MAKKLQWLIALYRLGQEPLNTVCKFIQIKKKINLLSVVYYELPREVHQLVVGILKDHLVSSLSLPPFLIIKDQEVWLRLSISHAPPSLQLMTVSEISIIYNCIIVLIVTWKTNEYTQVCNPPQTPPSFDKQLKKHNKTF